MKRKLWFGAAFMLVAFTVTSCEDLGGCKTCKMVTRTSSGSIVDEGSETEYCGADLVTVQASPAVTNPVSGNVTDYECR